MLKINERNNERYVEVNLNRTSHIPLHTSQRGITLIALIITIIVMLILVAVTITVAVNGGLFEHAGQAAADTQNAIDEEQTLASGRINIDGIWYDSMQAYVDGIPSTNQSGGTTDIAETFSNIYERNTPITQGSYTAVIPKGFAVGTSEGINKIEDGLVIQDAQGNQFVWIPVNYNATGTLDSNGLDSGFLAVFYRSEWSNNARITGLDTATYIEPYASGYTTPEGKTESEEYYEMMRSVQANKGFYIGRYEAGSTTPRAFSETDGTTYKANGTTQMVIKRDAYPYIVIECGSTMNDYTSDVMIYSKNQGKGAILLSKELYGKTEDEGKYGVVSTLCYGIQWDAMLDFVKEDNNVTDSTSWGNYYDSPWTVDRKTAKYCKFQLGDWEAINYHQGIWENISDLPGGKLTSGNGYAYLLTTGASETFATKNIFDVAGNALDLTMEAFNTYNLRVYRGGQWCAATGSDHPASTRYIPYSFYGPGGASFRTTLYIK